MVKILNAKAEDPGSIPGLVRSPEEEMAAHSVFMRILWREEPGRLQSIGSQRVRYN